jgi:transposase InsO family protein
MKHFEAECAQRKIALYVLPPKRPQYNGGVERGNRTFREEFYARSDLLADSIGHINYELQKAVSKYNSYRPHFSLKGMTPFEYYHYLSVA